MSVGLDPADRGSKKPSTFRNSAKRSKLAITLVIVSALSVVAGMLKIWTHYFSVWRSGYLDYAFGLAAICVGLISIVFLVKPLKGSLVTGACVIFILVVSYKFILDPRDTKDVLLSVLIIGLGAITIWRSRRISR